MRRRQFSPTGNPNYSNTAQRAQQKELNRYSSNHSGNASADQPTERLRDIPELSDEADEEGKKAEEEQQKQHQDLLDAQLDMEELNAEELQPLDDFFQQEQRPI